jgi:hypothetical protein
MHSPADVCLPGRAQHCCHVYLNCPNKPVQLSNVIAPGVRSNTLALRAVPQCTRHNPELAGFCGPGEHPLLTRTGDGVGCSHGHGGVCADSGHRIAGAAARNPQSPLPTSRCATLTSARGLVSPQFPLALPLSPFDPARAQNASPSAVVKLSPPLSVTLPSVIWSTVGVVCPAWSSGVDKACSSQYFDSLFAYSLLGCFELRC